MSAGFFHTGDMGYFARDGQADDITYSTELSDIHVHTHTHTNGNMQLDINIGNVFIFGEKSDLIQIKEFQVQNWVLALYLFQRQISGRCISFSVEWLRCFSDIQNSLKVYPVELEGMILLHPEVQEAAVVKVDNKSLGQVPRAFVVKVIARFQH